MAYRFALTVLLSVSILKTGQVKSQQNGFIVKDLDLVEDKQNSNIIITMASRPDDIFDSINSQSFPNNVKKTEAMVQALTTLATVTQAPVKLFLDSPGLETIQWKSFWMTNQILVQNASAPLILQLAAFFTPLILEITREVVVQRFPVFDDTIAAKPQGLQWGVEQMGAPGAWDSRVTGQNVRVAILDTGCRASHVDINRPDIMWKDAVVPASDTASIPTDPDGHGTHCAGTILGKNGVGMAPDAKLMACRCCTSVGCTQGSLMDCAQWACCPDGATDCSRKAQVVSNSWGGSGGQTWFDGCIAAWRNAGIIPVFAAGNSGPSCSTMSSPGDNLQVLGVGAIDSTFSCASFSSRGPAVTSTSTTKPDSHSVLLLPNICAPGVNIVSCSHTTDTGYRSLSGTSMACPHVTGFVTLLLSAFPDMNYNDIKQLAISTASTNANSGNTACGGKADVPIPNFIFGGGCPNAIRAINSMRSLKGLSQDTKARVE